MTSDPDITVIITYHNEGELVNRAIDSVLSQDVDATFEILIVDDQSDAPPHPR